MRRSSLLAILLLLTGMLPGQALRTDDALSYFDYLNAEYSRLANASLEYLQLAVHSDRPAAVESARGQLIAGIHDMRKRLDGVEPPAADHGMYAAFRKLLDRYAALFATELQQTGSLLSRRHASYRDMETYLLLYQQAEEALAAEADRFLAVQREFASREGIRLIGAQTHSIARQINQLNVYQRSIFLPVYRVQAAQSDFMAAYEQRDAHAMMQARVEIVKQAAASIAVLQERSGFRDNTTYRDAGLSLLHTLQELAERDYPALIRMVAQDGKVTVAEAEDYRQALGRVQDSYASRLKTFNEALQELLRANVPQPAVRETHRL